MLTSYIHLPQPVPNYFLDPEDEKQFPPHIALLVILQDGEKESRKFDRVISRILFALFAIVSLLLRITLEVIGGAGAIWGGAEVYFRNPNIVTTSCMLSHICCTSYASTCLGGEAPYC
jgi:hypothetical protein